MYYYQLSLITSDVVTKAMIYESKCAPEPTLIILGEERYIINSVCNFIFIVLMEFNS
jgi:hypothetical protein